MVKIVLDAGHGINTAGKRTPDDEREWSFNNKVLLAATAKLNIYENVKVLRLDDSSGKTDIPLSARTAKANAWEADVLVSIHHNAFASKWGSHGGVETLVQEITASKASKEIAALIQPRIVKVMGLRDRGVKTDNLHMLRESNMSAILTEGGFMDSTTDIGALRSDAKLKAQGDAIAEGLATYFKLKPKGEVKVSNAKGVDGRNDKPTASLAVEFKEAIEAGITDGTYPNRLATRAEVAVMIYRAMKNK